MKEIDEKIKEIEAQILKDDSIEVGVKSGLINFGVISTLILVIGTSIMAYKRPDLVQVKDILTTCLVGFACTTLLFTARAFAHNKNVNKHKILLDERKAIKDAANALNETAYRKKVYALDLMKELHSPAMIIHGDIVYRFFKEIKGSGIDISAAMKDLKYAHKRRSVLIMLNYFERIGLACENEMADSTLLKKFFRGVFVHYQSTLDKYFKDRRDELDNQRIFQHFEETAKTWKKEQ